MAGPLAASPLAASPLLTDRVPVRWADGLGAVYGEGAS